MTLAEMARRYRAGESLSQIAAAEGCALDTVSNRLRLMGVQIRPRGGPNRWPRVDRAERRARISVLYYDERLSISDIAARIGTSTYTVWNELREIGFPRRPPGRQSGEGRRARAGTMPA